VPDERPQPEQKQKQKPIAAPSTIAAPLMTAVPSASPEQAAAIVAALERFMRATAVPANAAPQTPNCWRRAAVVEGVSREPQDGARDPWLATPG
jgi:hypothetical protein